MNAFEIKKNRERYNLTQEDLAKMLHSSRKTINSYENGASIPKSKIELLIRLFDDLKLKEEVVLNSNNIAGDIRAGRDVVGSGIVNDSNVVVGDNNKVSNGREEKKEDAIIQGKIKIPYYDVDFAGGWSSEELFSSIQPSYYISAPEFDRAEFACNLRGNSISKRIKSGSIVGLKEIRNWETYFPTNELYGVITKNDLRTIKIVKRSKEKGFLDLIPDALPEYNDPPYEAEQIPINFIQKMFQVVAWGFYERLVM